MKISLLSFFLFLLLASCGVDNEQVDKKKTSEIPIISDTLSVDFLLFKAEKLLEIWEVQTEGQNEKIKSIQLNDHMDWPIGVFDWNLKDEPTRHSVLTSPFYQTKLGKKTIENFQMEFKRDFKTVLTKEDFDYLYALSETYPSSKLLILPNKPLENGYFKAQLNVPHWTAELYAMLELEIKNYR